MQRDLGERRGPEVLVRLPASDVIPELEDRRRATGMSQEGASLTLSDRLEVLRHVHRTPKPFGVARRNSSRDIGP